MMRIFQFRDPTPIEALVLAADQDDATELFEEYVLRQGGDPDTLLWRELSMHHLDDDAAPMVQEALELVREGLVVCEAEDRWIFVVPLGARNQNAINGG